MNAQLEQIRKDIGATSDQQLADFIGVSRRSICSLKEGVAPSKRMQRLLDDAQTRAQSARSEPAQYAQSAQPFAVREPSPRYEFAQPAAKPALLTAPPRPRFIGVSRVKTTSNITELEERLEHALEEILEVRKELRRMKS